MERLQVRLCRFNSEGPSLVLLSVPTISQPDNQGHNGALGEAVMVQTRQPSGILHPGPDDFHEPIFWDVELGARGKRVGGLHTSWDPVSQGISDSLMHQDKRAEATPQEKGSEASGPNSSGDTAE